MSATETGNITQFFIDRETEFPGDIAPIGYPAQDMEIVLLDDAGNLVRAGDAGEVAVKSRYLACGYWRRPELTNEKFRDDPDGGEERVYLTGDQGRAESDGCLFHLGRKDDQIKVRGYRVEVAEIEAALLRLGYFTKAFVTLRERGSAEKSLVAYLVPEKRPAPTSSALRKALAATLPNHVIPAVFVMLDSMPLTPTRKVDRNALPEPGNDRPEMDTPFVAPGTAVEGALAKNWRDVLSLDQVGIHDNFFELGGDSLAAIRMVSRVVQMFGIELPIKALIDSPTVAAMAGVIEGNQAKRASQEDLERMLRELEALTDEEAQRLLAAVSRANSKTSGHKPS
jgi:acyl carrier protein